MTEESKNNPTILTYNIARKRASLDRNVIQKTIKDEDGRNLSIENLNERKMSSFDKTPKREKLGYISILKSQQDIMFRV